MYAHHVKGRIVIIEGREVNEGGEYTWVDEMCLDRIVNTVVSCMHAT